VGQTISPNKRWNQHFRSKNHLGYALRKYGVDNFSFEILHTIEYDNYDNLRLSLDKLEQYYIATLGTFHDGYNETSGGSANHTLSKEARLKIIAKNTGKKRTDEFKKKTSILHKGKTVSKETRGKIRASHMGKKHTPETRERMSVAHKKHECSEETKNKIRANANDRYANMSIEEKQKKAEKISDKAKKKKVQCIETGVTYNSLAEAQSITSIDRRSIARACTNKIKTAGGFTWSWYRVNT